MSPSFEQIRWHRENFLINSYKKTPTPRTSINWSIICSSLKVDLQTLEKRRSSFVKKKLLQCNFYLFSLKRSHYNVKSLLLFMICITNLVPVYSRLYLRYWWTPENTLVLAGRVPPYSGGTLRHDINWRYKDALHCNVLKIQEQMKSDVFILHYVILRVRKPGNSRVVSGAIS